MANEYLTRVNTSTGNKKVYTWSAWIKLSNDGASGHRFFGSGPSAAQGGHGYFGIVSDALYVVGYDGAAYTYQLSFSTTELHRDFSGWMHILIAYDSTQTLEYDRLNVYQNGKKLGSFANVQYPLANANDYYNTSGSNHYIGRRGLGGDQYQGQIFDLFWVDGQALTPDVFGFYKEGDGYVSAGSTQATDFRSGQWSPRSPKSIKYEINRRGGFGVNGFYLPMNDSSNFGADFHCEPNSIITLKGEDLPQPRNGAPDTSDAYVSQLRSDPYAANLVLAVPGIIGGQGSGYGDYSADIKGSGSNKTVTANGNAGVAVTPSYYGSAMSFDGSGDFFSIPDNDDFNFGSGDFTVEAWIKTDTSNVKTFSVVLNQSISNATSDSAFYFGAGVDGTSLYLSTSGNSWTDNVTSDVGISTVGWVHQVWQRRGTYLELYTNGVNVGTKTNFSGTVYNSTRDVQIGVQATAGSSDFDGYIQDLRVYKGVAKYKGGFDVPKPYTPVGIESWRAVPDSTANNFATLNPIQTVRTTTTDGNLSWSASTAYAYGQGTIGIPSTGKWVFEGRFNTNTTTNNYNSIGVGISNPTAAPFGGNPGAGTYGINDASSFGQSFVLNGSRQGSITLPAGTIIQVLIDRDNNQMTFVKDGTLQTGTGSTVTIPSDGVLYPMIGEWNVSGQINFGQNPTFSGTVTAGTFTDSNGKGLFKYQPPAGFLALCEDNLPTPAIADPGKHFKTVLYTGNNSSRAITGVGFKPDLVWIMPRNNSGAYFNAVFDSVRGPNKVISTNSTAAENSAGNWTQQFMSFDNDGFSLGTNGDSGNYVNLDAYNYVAWCWKAGGAVEPATVTGEFVSATRSVNQDAGFAIINVVESSTTGMGTVEHGLGRTPAFAINKSRTRASGSWHIWHKDFANTDEGYMHFNTSGEQATAGQTAFSGSTMSDTIYNYRNGWIGYGDGGTSINYVWAEIEGFSKFGSYSTNSSPDGPFVYLGFKPAFLLVKPTYTSNWIIMDSSRGPTNPDLGWLYPDLSYFEESGAGRYCDFLSNGFKVRNGGTGMNDGGTVIYAAFAESPFQTANAK